MRENYESILRIRPALILVSLLNKGKRYSSQLARESNCSSSHAVKILKQFEEIGLITTEKNGGIKELRLTEKGKELAENINKIVLVLSQEPTTKVVGL